MLIPTEGITTMPEITSPEEAVQLAIDAIQFTRRILANGNCNPYEGVPGTEFKSPEMIVLEEVQKMRDHPIVVDPGDSIRHTLCRAKVAMGAKCGNCGEYAAVAFAYLFARGASPIMLASYPNSTWDHCFVIIGPQGKPGSVICDPWADLYCSLEIRDRWKEHIWGDEVPPDDGASVLTLVEDDCGGPDAYNSLTQDQTTYDAMDMSF